MVQGTIKPQQKRVSTEGMKKVDSTIGWFNRHGGLQGPIDFNRVSATLHAIPPQQALHVLNGLKGKEGTIRNPTAWVQKAASGYVGTLDSKVHKTINWYNKNGGLKQEIHYQTVKPLMASLPPGTALHILKGLEEKATEINDPTSWIVAAAQKQIARQGGPAAQQGGNAFGGPAQGGFGGFGGMGSFGGFSEGDEKVKKTIGWYNHQGGLQQPIHYKEVAPLLQAVGSSTALQILKNLEQKGPTITNPTAWVASAARKLMGRNMQA